MRLADARRQASVIINNSIKFSAGGFVGCTMNTSRPRTFSINSAFTSPSLKRPTCARPIGTCRWRVISSANAGFALPANTEMGEDSKSLLRDIAATSQTLTHSWLGWKDYSALRASPFPSQPKLGPFSIDESSPPQKYGWGGRIRTSVWRDQNPLPYRLATPQWNQQSANSLEPVLSLSLIFQARASHSIREPKIHPAPAVTSAQFPIQAQSSRRPKKHRPRFPSGAPD